MYIFTIHDRSEGFTYADKGTGGSLEITLSDTERLEQFFAKSITNTMDAFEKDTDFKKTIIFLDFGEDKKDLYEYTLSYISLNFAEKYNVNKTAILSIFKTNQIWLNTIVPEIEIKSFAECVTSVVPDDVELFKQVKII